MIRKLATLLITLIVSCNVFSQNVTVGNSCVVLQIDTARMVASELVEKDMLEEQSRILRDSLGILKEINAEQDSTIIIYEQQKILFSLEFREYEKRLQEDLVLQEKLKHQIKLNKAWAIGLGGTTTLAIVTTVLALTLRK